MCIDVASKWSLKDLSTTWVVIWPKKLGLAWILNISKVIHFVHMNCFFHKIHNPRITKLCHIIITVHNLWKEEGGLFGCYHCLVMLLPAGKGGNPRISRFRSIVFLCGANKYFSVFLHCICVCTSSRLLFTVNYGILNQRSIVVLHQWPPTASCFNLFHWNYLFLYCIGKMLLLAL